MGEKLSDDDIEDMMKEADTDGDGQISFPGNFNLLLYSLLYSIF
jgi:Ca2+-binding EF-hand superfamily protein